MSRLIAATIDQIVISGFPNLLLTNPGIAYAGSINPTGYGNPSSGRIVSFVNLVTGKGHVLNLGSGSGGQIIATFSKSVSDAQAIGAFPSSLFNNEWKYIAMTYKPNDGGPRLYIGTAAVAEKEMTYVSRTDGSGTLIDPSGYPLIIGNSGAAGGNAFQGRLADITVWNGALLLASLDKLRLFPSAIVHKFAEAALQAHWPLADNETTSTLRDLSGNGNMAVATGTKPDHNPARETMGSSGW